jgi:hypothetical protein
MGTDYTLSYGLTGSAHRLAELAPVMDACDRPGPLAPPDRPRAPWAAARAAARAEARDAARSALRPTLNTLQHSAFALLERMLLTVPVGAASRRPAGAGTARTDCVPVCAVCEIDSVDIVREGQLGSNR